MKEQDRENVKKHLLSTIGVEEETITVQVYVCSNGYRTRNFFDANLHEAKLIVHEIFSGITTRSSRKYTTHRERILDVFKGFSIECGKYTITVRNEDDLAALNFYFQGIAEQLGYPEKFPFQFTLDVYFDACFDQINPHPSWKACDMKEINTQQ